MRTSGQVRVDKYCPQQSQRNRQIGLDANDGIMETDGEGKFVSFKVVLGSTSLFKINHSPAGIDCLVCRFYWSTGAAEGLIMKDSGTNLRRRRSKKMFVCDSCCGQNVDLDREEGNLRSYHRSITLLPMFVRYVGECALTATVWRKRERERERGEREREERETERERERERKEQSRKSGRRDLLKWTSFVCLFVSLHCKTVACQK